MRHSAHRPTVRACAYVAILACSAGVSAHGANLAGGIVAAGTAPAVADRHAYAGHADYGVPVHPAMAVSDGDVVEASRVGVLVRLHRAVEEDMAAVRPAPPRASAVAKRTAPARAASARRLKRT